MDYVIHLVAALGALYIALLYAQQKALAQTHRQPASAYVTAMRAVADMRIGDWIVMGVAFFCTVHVAGCAPVAAALSALYLLQRGYEFVDAKSAAEDVEAARIASAIHGCRHVIRGDTYTFLVRKAGRGNALELLVLRNGAPHHETHVSVVIESEAHVPYTLWMAVAQGTVIAELARKTT